MSRLATIRTALSLFGVTIVSCMLGACGDSASNGNATGGTQSGSLVGGTSATGGVSSKGSAGSQVAAKVASGGFLAIGGSSSNGGGSGTAQVVTGGQSHGATTTSGGTAVTGGTSNIAVTTSTSIGGGVASGGSSTSMTTSLTGGNLSTGGNAGSGGNGLGGITGIGGSVAPGGTTGSGGSANTSGTAATGGSSPATAQTGGFPNVAGTSATGGMVASGGSGGTQTTGGTSAIEALALGCGETTLSGVNLYVIGDATPTGGDTEGSLYVGGNLHAVGSYSVGMKNPSSCTSYALVVGGDISLGGGFVDGGKAAYGGTKANVTGVSFACGGLRVATPIDFGVLAKQVSNLSTELSKLPANGIVSGNTLTGSDPSYNVFTINAAQLGNINVNFPTGSTVIVNVSGTTVDWRSAAVCCNQQCDDSVEGRQVIWNFYQATNISVFGIAVQGSVLAPLARLDGGGGNIAGQVIVGSMTGGLEYHPYYFAGCVTPPSI